MIVAITCNGNTPEATIDQRFGRCAYFAFFNTETQALEFFENPNLNAQEGAGPASVSFVANKNAQKIISGEFGFKIKEILNDLNIQMVIMKEEKTVRDIIALLNQN